MTEPELKPCPYVIAGPWTDDNGITTCEIQIVGGHEVVAEIYADKADSAKRMAEQAIAAWNARPAADAEPVQAYAEWQQKRGMLADAVDWAINEYDQFMLDDAYDSQSVLDRVIGRLRDIRSIGIGDTSPAITEDAESIRAKALEEAADIAKTGWVSADYDVVGIADADMAMRLCDHISSSIRALGKD